MKWLQRAIRPVLLVACGLVYVVFIVQFAQYHYRVHRLRALLEDVQTLEVGKSTYADAAAIAGRYSEFLNPKPNCTNSDCKWLMRSYPMPFLDIVAWACTRGSIACDFLHSLSDSRILNSLGLRHSFVWAVLEIHEGRVKYVGAGLGVEFLSHRWLESGWNFMPESPEPWMEDWQKSRYNLSDEETPGIRSRSANLHAGNHLGETLQYVITPSTPKVLRQKARQLEWDCWNGLANCLEITPEAKRNYGHFFFLDSPIRPGPTPNGTIFFLGILSILMGAICLAGSRASIRLEVRTFILTSLGILLFVLGVAAIYITKVADDVSLWVWLAAALIFIFLAWIEPLNETSRFLRVPVHGSVAIFSGSLMGGLVDVEDHAGLFVLGAVAVLWILVARQVAPTVIEKVLRTSVSIGAAAFATSLYLVSRFETASFDDLRLASLRMPFQQWVPLPEWFDRFDLDIWLKIALITSFLLVGLLSAAFFIMRGRRATHVAQPINP